MGRSPQRVGSASEHRECARWVGISASDVCSISKQPANRGYPIGPEHTGRLMGITNMVAALPGLVGGVLTGIILDTTNSWDMVFYVVAGVTFFGGIFYFLFASTEKQFD